MEQQKPIRKFDKPHRLAAFDYSSVCSYMLTFDLKNRDQHLLSEIVYRGMYQPPLVKLKPYGEITEKYIKRIETVYKGVLVDNYVIMPNHVHLLLTIIERDSEYEKPKGNNISRIASIIRSTKNMITREIGRSIWQKDFYDTIADTEEIFIRCDNYIDNNPASWLEKHGLEPEYPK
ncbi:MAG: transposase [Clostridia bacterium]|nr:transposase [Clostridia bacterium]